MSVSGSGRARRRLAPRDRQQEILNAALELFAQRPVDLVSVDEVAAAASASPALVYHYFGSKPQLASHVLRATADELIGLMKSDPDRPAAVQLSTGLGTYLNYLQRHPHSWSALLRAGQGGAGAAAGIAAEFDEFSLNMALAAVRAPSPRGPALDLALRGWLAATKEICLHWLADGVPDRAAVETLLAALFDGALRAAAAADPAFAECHRNFVNGA